MLIPLKLLPRRWNDAGYLILLERKRRKKQLHVFIWSHYLDVWSFFRAIMPQLWGDWFYDRRYKTGKIYGFGYRCNDSARYIPLMHIALINDRFSLHISQLHLRHFVTIFFFYFHVSFDYAKILTVGSSFLFLFDIS